MAERMTGPGWQIAECLLPGVTEASADELTRRIEDELAGSAGGRVWLAGAILIPQDEVLLCLFAGTLADVRTVSQRAGLPFDRILGCVALGQLADARTPGQNATTANRTGERQ